MPGTFSFVLSVIDTDSKPFRRLPAAPSTFSFFSGFMWLLFVLINGSCQKGFETENAIIRSASSDEAVAAPVLREYSVSPAATDPAINTFLAAHYSSINEGAPLKNTLFLFIP